MTSCIRSPGFGAGERLKALRSSEVGIEFALGYKGAISQCVREPNAMLRLCYRCRTQREERYFEFPVELCLLCYSTIRGNEGLSLSQLRAKARRARKGKHQRRVSIVSEIQKQFDSESPLAMLENVRCDSCGNQRAIEAFSNEQGELAFELCSECRMREESK